MLHKPSVSLHNIYTGVRLNATRAIGARFSTGQYGAEQLSFSVPATRVDALALLDRLGSAEARVTAGADRLWAGRIEDAKIVDGGVDLTAYGWWRALADLPYTALWSVTNTGLFKPTTVSEESFRLPHLYQFETRDAIKVLFVKDNAYPTNEGGSLNLRVPHSASKDALRIKFDYESILPSAVWYMGWNAYNESYVGLAGSTVITGTGALQTGTIDVALPAGTRIVQLWVYGGPYTETAETGDHFSRWFNVRITADTTPITPTKILTHLLTQAPLLTQSTALIAANTLDLNDEIYEDAYPDEIAARLASYGDDAGNAWDVGVDAYRRLYYHKRGTRAREWHVYVDAIDFERSLKGMANEAYAVHETPDSRIVRTATTANAVSKLRSGITRRIAVDVSTSSPVQAQYLRDVALADAAVLTPQGGFAVRYVSGAQHGHRIPAWNVKAGDYVTLCGLPLPDSQAALGSRRFRVAHTEYDCEAGVCTIEPDEPVKMLEMILGRATEGLRSEFDSPLNRTGKPIQMGREREDQYRPPIQLGRIRDNFGVPQIGAGERFRR